MKDILFIHGMFMTGRSWAPWIERFEARGFRCHAPSWPGHDGAAAELRAAPDPQLATLGLADVVAAVRAVACALEAPILVGHSMGGLVVQLLLQQGIGARGVAIAPAPPHGVRSFAWSHLRSNAALFKPGTSPIVPSASWFRYAFANIQTEAEACTLYDQYCVCESRLVGKSSLGDAAGAPVTFEELANHSHALCIEARWREVADAVDQAIATES